MTITLYSISDDPRNVSKTLGTGTDASGTARGSFPVTGGAVEIQSAANLNKFNYAYIAETGRYYFIEKIDVLRHDLYVLNLRVDVLMSYAAQIRSLTGTINRQENLYNGYIQDGRYQALSYSKIVAKTFPNAMTNDSIILMTVG